MKVIDRIKSLPDDMGNGGVFIYDRDGSQVDKIEVADLKNLVADYEQCKRVIRETIHTLKANNKMLETLP